jgi:hypothetical protein
MVGGAAQEAVKACVEVVHGGGGRQGWWHGAMQRDGAAGTKQGGTPQ